MAISSNPEPCYRCEELEEELQRMRDYSPRLYERDRILAEIENEVHIHQCEDWCCAGALLAEARRRVMGTSNET